MKYPGQATHQVDIHLHRSHQKCQVDRDIFHWHGHMFHHSNMCKSGYTQLHKFPEKQTQIAMLVVIFSYNIISVWYNQKLIKLNFYYKKV